MLILIRLNIGVGTPQRILDLIENGMICYSRNTISLSSRVGALSTSSLRTIVIDASHIDVKQRGILDMKDTLEPLLQLLTMSQIADGYAEKDNGRKLLFY